MRGCTTKNVYEMNGRCRMAIITLWETQPPSTKRVLSEAVLVISRNSARFYLRNNIEKIDEIFYRLAIRIVNGTDKDKELHGLKKGPNDIRTWSIEWDGTGRFHEAVQKQIQEVIHDLNYIP